MPRKPLTTIEKLRRKQQKVEKDLQRYKRQTYLYLNKMWKAQERLAYYNRRIEKALKSAPKDATRVVEI